MATRLLLYTLGSSQNRRNTIDKSEKGTLNQREKVTFGNVKTFFKAICESKSRRMDFGDATSRANRCSIVRQCANFIGSEMKSKGSENQPVRN